MGTLCSSVTLSRGGATSMLADLPDGFQPGRTAVMLLAHGAGNDARSPFLEHFAAAVVARGMAVVRFNFPYKERTGTRPPDPMPVLADTFHDVVLAQAKRTGAPPGPIFLAGKSLGGRVAAAIVAEGRVRPSGLVFLGFPLHKPGDPENPRTDDLPKVRRPMLFLQGTRDPFGTPDEIRAVRRAMKLPGALHVVEGGDHSFAVTKSSGLSQRATLDAAADAIADFARKVLAKR